MNKPNWTGVLVVVLFAVLCLIQPEMAEAQTAAQGGTATAVGGETPGPMSPFQFILGTINFFLIAFLVYFMLVLRPAQIKLEKHEKFLKELKSGDRIMTSGGIFGKVVTVNPTAITVEIASGTKISVRPDHVSALPSEPVAASDAKATSVVKGGKVSAK